MILSLALYVGHLVLFSVLLVLGLLLPLFCWSFLLSPQQVGLPCLFPSLSHSDVFLNRMDSKLEWLEITEKVHHILTDNFDNILHLSEVRFYHFEHLEAKFCISTCNSCMICKKKKWQTFNSCSIQLIFQNFIFRSIHTQDTSRCDTLDEMYSTIEHSVIHRFPFKVITLIGLIKTTKSKGAYTT